MPRAKAPAVAFDDKIEGYHATTVYPVCNESIHIWRDVLSSHGVEVDEAASICSGGEISFFAILPFVKKSIELVDHCYTSMYYAIGKYHVINKHDVQEAWNKLMKEKKWGAPYVEIYSDGWYDKDGRFHFGKPPPKVIKTEPGTLAALFEEANKGIPTGKDPNHWRSFSLTSMQHAWKDLTLDDLKAFKESLSKIRFVHDDINGLKERGPFDLIYLSNALQYSSKGGKCMDLKPMVKPGGWACLAYGGSAKPSTDNNYFTPAQVRDWEHVECKAYTSYTDHPEREKFYSNMGSWTYNLFKAPE